jgi:hypothetical protein
VVADQWPWAIGHRPSFGIGILYFCKGGGVKKNDESDVHLLQRPKKILPLLFFLIDFFNALFGRFSNKKNPIWARISNLKSQKSA